MGNYKRKLFINISNNRYATLEAVSSDTIGPISTQGLSENTYLQLISDHGTTSLVGAPMKKKGEAFDTIHKALARLKLICRKKVDRFHTDNANEQNIGKLKEFLQNHGYLRKMTAPGPSPSNALVKRRFESFFAAARTALSESPPPVNGKAYWSFAS